MVRNFWKNLLPNKFATQSRSKCCIKHKYSVHLKSAAKPPYLIHFVTVADKCFWRGIRYGFDTHLRRLEIWPIGCENMFSSRCNMKGNAFIVVCSVLSEIDNLTRLSTDWSIDNGTWRPWSCSGFTIVMNGAKCFVPSINSNDFITTLIDNWFVHFNDIDM